MAHTLLTCVLVAWWDSAIAGAAAAGAAPLLFQVCWCSVYALAQVQYAGTVGGEGEDVQDRQQAQLSTCCGSCAGRCLNFSWTRPAMTCWVQADAEHCCLGPCARTFQHSGLAISCGAALLPCALHPCLPLPALPSRLVFSGCPHLCSAGTQCSWLEHSTGLQQM